MRKLKVDDEGNEVDKVLNGWTLEKCKEKDGEEGVGPELMRLLFQGEARGNGEIWLDDEKDHKGE